MEKRERTIEQVVAELKMLAARETKTRQDKFRFAVATMAILTSMSKADWEEFQRERAECQKTEPMGNAGRSPG